MKKFRLQNNVPDVYVKQSRDFQLMCNLFDLMNNGVKFDIDTIRSLSDTQFCRDSMMTYLQHKLGLHMDASVTDDTLRMILKCFPYLVRKKGSREGIIAAVCVFLTAVHSDGKYEVEITNVPSTVSAAKGDYSILITVETNRVENVDILDQILKYILPTGYKIDYDFIMSASGLSTEPGQSDEIHITISHENYGSRVRSFRKGTAINDDPNVLGGIGTTLVRVSMVEPNSENSSYDYLSNTSTTTVNDANNQRQNYFAEYPD